MGVQIPCRALCEFNQSIHGPNLEKVSVSESEWKTNSPRKTYENQYSSEVDNSQQAGPMLILGNASNNMFFLPGTLIALSDKLGEALGGEVEADRGNGEQAESYKLDNHTYLGDVLASVELVPRIFIHAVHRGDHDCTAHLEQ